MTPVGNTKVEIVFRIAVRGRTSDLAQFLDTVNKAHAVVMLIIEKPAAPVEQGQTDVTTTVGDHSE